jgi:hypothetical protein
MSLKTGLRWYARRLSVMGPAEIAHRVREQGTLLLMRLQAALGAVPRPAGLKEPARAQFCSARNHQLPDLCWDVAPIAAAEDLLAGHWPALGFPWRWEAGPAAWRRAPDTGRLWPATFFGSIPYRVGNPYGDIRVAWEPSRLQQLVSLGLLARELPEARARQAVILLEDQLLAWVAENPPMLGIHFVSAMECALRLIAVCHAVDLVRDRLTRPETVFAALVELVGSHASFIERRLSVHSSAGNHTIAEAAGLVYAGCLFPEFDRARQWRQRGVGLLVQESARQILDDGGGTEQAFWYLLLITDLCGLVIELLKHRGEEPPAELAHRVAIGRLFLGSLADRPVSLPSVGDSDSGYALSPALLLSFASAPARATHTTFPAAGYSLCRSPAGPHWQMLFDHGPLGIAPSYGHGHADALAITLRQADIDLLIDPGTYTYTGDPQWRSYFRSTAAHNTVTVDGEDQALQVTAFMWSAPFRCEILRAESAGGVVRILARHDGYRRGVNNIQHIRGVAFRSEGRITVWDCVTGAGEHTVELAWHAGVPLLQEGDRWRLGADVWLEVSGDTTGKGHGVASVAQSGWRSRLYGVREPVTTLRTTWRGRLPCQFMTRIFFVDTELPMSMAREDQGVFASWL